MNPTCILLFVKVPQPGRVKTRLAASIGQARALALYQCFVQDILATLSQTPTWDLLIFYAPAAARPQSWLGHQYHYVAQEGSDLGARMAQAFRHAFGLGYRRALVLGSDSPDLPHRYLEQACHALAAEQRVIGPSQDGGYYTLGFTQQNFAPAVFEHIPWSTSTVFSQTWARLIAEPDPICRLPSWFDIDTLDDLRQFYHRSQRSLAQSPGHTWQYLADHLDLLDAV